MRAKLAYYSTHAPNFPFSSLEGLLNRAREYNNRTGITSILAMTDSHFIHLLEGQREAVSLAFARIIADPRHERVSLFGCVESKEGISTTEPIEFVGPPIFNKAFCIKTARMPRIVPTLLSFQNVESILSTAVADEKAAAKTRKFVTGSSSDDYFDISV